MSVGLCQLASNWSGVMPDHGMLSEEKIDGWRALWLRDHVGRPGLYTRNGMPIHGVDHITYWLHRIETAAGEPLFIDGEFQVDGTLAATKAWCERGWKAGGEAGQFFAFDCLTLSEWREGGTDSPLIERKAMLRELAAVALGEAWEWRPGSYGRDIGNHPVTVLEDCWLNDPEDVRRAVCEVWSRNGEGMMLKDAEAGYWRTRNALWLKVKRENMLKWSLVREVA